MTVGFLFPVFLQPSLAVPAGQMTECMFFGTFVCLLLETGDSGYPGSIRFQPNSNQIQSLKRSRNPETSRATKTIKSFLFCRFVFSKEISLSPARHSNRSHSLSCVPSAQVRPGAINHGAPPVETGSVHHPRFRRAPILRRFGCIESQLAAEGNK